MTLHLRAPCEEDIPALVELVNCPGVRRGTTRLPLTNAEWVKARVPNKDPNITSVVALVDGQARGWSALVRGKDRCAHTAEIGVTVHDGFVRQGMGRAMMEALLDVADNWLGLRRVYLHANADNAPAIALYHAMGFEHEGTLRGDVMRDGVLIDSHVMARLRAAPQFAYLSRGA